MLIHPNPEQLAELRLTGMHKALGEQLDMNDLQELSFDERLGLMLDREITERDDRRLQYRLRKARLKRNRSFCDVIAFRRQLCCRSIPA